MRLSKIQLSGLAIAIMSSASVSAANLSQIMPTTTGNIDAMGGLNYAINGEANYIYGYNDAKSGYQNSNFGARFATQNSNSANMSLGLEVGSKYKPEDNKYKANVTGDFGIGMNGHTVMVGNDNWFTKSILPAMYKTNLDTNFSQNALGEKINDYNWFAGYSLMHQDLDIGFKVDEDKNFDISFGKYFAETQYDLHLFDYNDKFGAYAAATTDLSNTTLVTIGAGHISGELTYTAALSSVFESGFSVFSNVIGHGSFATTSFGGDYTYHNVTLYLEGSVDIGNSSTRERENKVGTGLKLIF